MRSAVIVTIVLLASCSTPAPITPVVDDPKPRAVTAFEPDAGDAQAMLVAARTATPVRANEYRLEAAAALLDSGTPVGTILDDVDTEVAGPEQLRRYLVLRARDALLGNDPSLALRWLGDGRLQQIPLDRAAQVELGTMKSDTYAAMRSFLASARERVYVHSLMDQAARAANTEVIFNTLRKLPEGVLRRQAEREITPEVRGWLSLAELAQRHAEDPQRTLLELDRWRIAWGEHPAALRPPRSLVMLREVVARQPRRIALLLPLHGNLAPYGRAIRDGIIGAHFHATDGQQDPPTIAVYDTSAADLANVLGTARREGAELIIGPLDRERVAEALRIAGSEVPIIALNRAAQTTPGASQSAPVYQFGLAPDDEIMQVVAQTLREGHRRVLAIAPDSEWGRRNFDLFAGTWTARGGEVIDSLIFPPDGDVSKLVKGLLDVDDSEARASDLRRITGLTFEHKPRRRQDVDFVFILASPAQAGALKPTLDFYFAEDLPVYATSHVHEPNADRMAMLDVDRIRFCDMPWKLTPGDSAQRLITAAWPEANGPLAPFFALGVDAYRLYARLQQLESIPGERVLGRTGTLRLTPDRVVQRELLWAQFREGQVKPQPMVVSTE